MPQDSQSAPLTVEGAAQQFAAKGLLTPEGSESPEAAASAEPDGATAEDSAAVEPSNEPAPETGATETSADSGHGDQRTPEELKRDLLADYTRKTQAAAELRRAADADQQAAREALKQHQQSLAELRKGLEALRPPDPDEALRASDPQAYLLKRLEYEDAQRRIDQIKAKEAELEGKRREDDAKAYQAHLTSEQEKLMGLVPEWRDPATAKTEFGKLADAARAYGFNDQEIAGVTDHRTVLLLRDAMRYRELQAKKPQAQRKVEQVKAAQPGALRTPDVGADEKKALANLQKSGRKDDAAAAFLARIKRQGGS